MTDWPQILNEHGGIVWQTVRRLLNDDADAADCFQETFVAALVFARQQPVQNWVGLLKQLATARALDRMRKRARARTLPLPVGAASEPALGLRYFSRKALRIAAPASDTGLAPRA